MVRVARFMHRIKCKYQCVERNKLIDETKSADGAIHTENNLRPIDLSLDIMRPVIGGISHASTGGSNKINAALFIGFDSA